MRQRNGEQNRAIRRNPAPGEREASEIPAMPKTGADERRRRCPLGVITKDTGAGNGTSIIQAAYNQEVKVVFTAMLDTAGFPVSQVRILSPPLQNIYGNDIKRIHKHHYPTSGKRDY